MQKMGIYDLMTELDDARLTAKANGQACATVSATMSKANLMELLGRIDSDFDNEVLPVKIIVNVKSARKFEQLAGINTNGD